MKLTAVLTALIFAVILFVKAGAAFEKLAENTNGGGFAGITYVTNLERE